jgi:hypothetical protein
MTQDLLQSLHVLYNTINASFSMQPSLYQPKSGLLLTITLESLDKVGIKLADE